MDDIGHLVRPRCGRGLVSDRDRANGPSNWEAERPRRRPTLYTIRRSDGNRFDEPGLVADTAATAMDDLQQRVGRPDRRLEGSAARR